MFVSTNFGVLSGIRYFLVEKSQLIFFVSHNCMKVIKCKQALLLIDLMTVAEPGFSCRGGH
jgi:hypothetical protein